MNKLGNSNSPMNANQTNGGVFSLVNRMLSYILHIIWFIVHDIFNDNSILLQQLEFHFFILIYMGDEETA